MFFQRPHIYAVYLNTQHPSAYETAEFVEERGSFWGFAFHAFWCFYHRLWIHGLVIAVLFGSVVLVGKHFGINPLTILALEFFIRLIVAFEGNEWRQNDLRRRGYFLSDIVTGTSELTAKQRYYQRWLDHLPTTIPQSIRPA
jgi:hypothetical protein